LRWQFSCGHDVETLEHAKASELPRRPRMCPVCQKPRNVVAQVELD
jgi:hypothetical protein